MIMLMYKMPFLIHGDLRLLIRSHKVKGESFLINQGEKTITAFSAPQQCATQ